MPCTTLRKGERVTTASSEATPSRHTVKPEDFYAAEAEKTKLNWFLFEYAMEMESAIRGDSRLVSALRRRGMGPANIGELCVHYAKSMKGQVLDRVAGRIKAVRIGYEEIEAFLPDAGDDLVDQLLTHAAEAWDTLTEACGECPTRCISERDQRASMFDDPDAGE